MNIFKIGLLLSVLMFNLSCSLLPDDEIPDSFETAETFYSVEYEDVNVTDHSFIDLPTYKNPKIIDLLNHLNNVGIYNTTSLEEMPEINTNLSLSLEELEEIEAELKELKTTTLERKLLQRLVSKLRQEAIQ